MWRKTILTIMVAFGAFSLWSGPAQPQTGANILAITMDGPIGPAYQEYLERGLNRAVSENAQAMIVRLNTPGGLLTTTREMASVILNAPVPVIVWVTPSGGHAASAGTFLLYAAHIAAMDEGTNIGAATPIEMGGGSPLPGPQNEEQSQDSTDNDAEEQTSGETGKATDAKMLEDTKAFMRGLAEMRGRNAEWAEKAITEAASLTAREALEKNVINFVAGTESDLLKQLDGREVALKSGKTVTLTTAGAQIIEYEPDWRTRFLVLITDPNIAFLLMTIGMYGLILEFYNPGTFIPGTIGVISLIIGLFALNVLPVNATGIVLMILGVALFAAEAVVPSFGILGFGGLVALIVGGMMMFDTGDMPGLALDGGVLAGVSLAGLLLLILIVWLTTLAYKRKTQTGLESMVGEKAEIVEWSGTQGRVRIQGEIWQAVSDEDIKAAPGDKLTVSAARDLVLKVIT